MESAITAPPPLRHYFGEARILRDWWRGRGAEEQLAKAYPGDGRAVVVLPGLFTTDTRTRMLRRVLNRAGYVSYGWGLGRNMPIKADILERFDAALHGIGISEDQPVALVGWSLGGIIAREYAKAYPDRVSQVITLGSPFSAHPRANRAWRIYELAADHKVDAPPLDTDTRLKPPCHTTAIWSSRDGIISVDSAKGLDGERDSEREIRCGHFAMSCAPDALQALLVSLSSQHG